MYYSHKDEEWKKRLCQMLAPFLRDGDFELQLWADDVGIPFGYRWHEEFQSALKSAGLAVMLVSASFLESEYVMKYELLEIISAAADGKIRLFWIYVSYAAYDTTGLELPEQDEILLRVARTSRLLPLARQIAQRSGTVATLFAILNRPSLKLRSTPSTQESKSFFQPALSPGDSAPLSTPRLPPPTSLTTTC